MKKDYLFNKYKKDFSDRISKIFEGIDKLEKEILNINIKKNFTLDISQLSIDELKREIIKYFQYNNGSLGFDIILIKYTLKEILKYIYLTEEKKLSEEEKNTCSLELKVRFYFFLNCIYNFKEKLESFFNISDNKGKGISFKNDTILSNNGKKYISELFNKSYEKIKDYCGARGSIVHGIYEIKYNILKNEINISTSKFNLSEENISGKVKRKYSFVLNDKKLVKLVEEMQKIRKKIIMFLLNTKKNIDLKKLTDKFKNGKGIYKF